VNDNICPKGGGLGIYDDFVHIDRRSKKARWDSRSMA
jgi:hypothetical protein